MRKELFHGEEKMRTYTIGQVAEIYQLSISQLRYYDKQGLFPFLQRTEKGDRVFTHDFLQLLDMILCLKNTGMPIKDIKQFVDWCMEGKRTAPDRLHMMKQQEQKVLQQLEDTKEYLTKIQEKILRLENEQ